MECVLASGIVANSEAFQDAYEPSKANIRNITCWRDVVSEDGKGPFEPLLQAFDEAEAIVSYNGLEFSFPLLKKYYGRKGGPRYMQHRLKCIDPFCNIRNVTTLWPTMDSLLTCNHIPFHPPKTNPIQLWNDQRRSELRSFSSNHARLLLELVVKKTLSLPGFGVLPNSVFGIAPFLACLRASQPSDA